MTALLVADEGGEGQQKLKKVLETVCGIVTDAYEVQMCVGISEWHEEIEKIHVAFAQARQTVNVYRGKKENCVEVYQAIYDTEKSCFHMEFFQRLYDFVLSGNREAICSTFTEMKKESAECYEKYGFRKFEIYYAISFVLQSVCQQKALTTNFHSYTNEELHNMTLTQCLDDLEKNAYRLCDHMEERKSRKNAAVRKRLLEYMGENFKRPELTVDLVAREVDTSEKYVFSIIKEETGKTFSAYLDELRVCYAKECLEKTNWSNERIAEEAGFGAVNSFYRVFKKYAGMSPNMYRKGKINNYKE